VFIEKLNPLTRRLFSVRRPGVLRYDPFPPQLGSVFEHLLPVAGQMFAVEYRRFYAVLANQVQERLLALDLRKLP
jgi:hypothetical protein